MSYPQDEIIISQQDIDKFEEWYDELEGFAYRSERVHFDIVDGNFSKKERHQNLRHWMLWAFTVGRHSK